MNPSKTIRAYTYISSKAACDPAKTIYICAPQEDAVSEEKLERFAVESGWQKIAEENEAILVLPVAEQGWADMPRSLLFDYYNETKNSFHTRSGRAIWGRTGTLWCWDTILYMVGYREGAAFAGNVLVNYPNFAAACALIGGLPADFSAGEQPSNHWMVRNVSADYAVKKKDIPVCLWLFDVEKDAAQKTMDYFSAANRAGDARRERLGSVDTIVRANEANPAWQVRLVGGRFADEKQRSSFIFDRLIARRVRWKNGPDGTLSFLDAKAEFYRDPRYLRHSVETGGVSYDYFVHLPGGKTPAQVKDLPVVFTVHGRGEPAWMFTKKNGWDTLSDETGAFVLVSPDSPGNIWFIRRDGEIFARIIDQLEEKYGIDRSRVYLTGFSNGAVMVRETALAYPELFAAASPSNGPWFDTTSMQQIDASKAPTDLTDEAYATIRRFEQEGWEMPCAFFYGDNDPGVRAEENRYLSVYCKANGCSAEPAETLTAENFFTAENGYREGDRFQTAVYRNRDGQARVCVTVMNNMPHGAIAEESRFAWHFLKRFRRPEGSRSVEQAEG